MCVVVVFATGGVDANAHRQQGLLDARGGGGPARVDLSPHVRTLEGGMDARASVDVLASTCLLGAELASCCWLLAAVRVPRECRTFRLLRARVRAKSELRAC